MPKSDKLLSSTSRDDRFGSTFDNFFNDGPNASVSFDPGPGLALPHGQKVLYAPTAAIATGSLGTTATSGIVHLANGATSVSPFVINITWDSSVAAAPAAFTAAVTAAAQYLESHYTDAVTVNINVGYGEVAGSAMGSGALGQSSSYLMNVTYASLVAALTADNKDATDASVIASMPAAIPVNGFVWITTAEGKALGLLSPNDPSTDGYVGFSSTYGFTYNNAGGVAPGTFDFNGTALHELTEIMGRIMLTGGSVGPYANSFTPLDMMHYAAPGVRDFSASTPGYFSVDSGTSNGGGFNTVAGGDSGDWGSTMGNDAGNAFSYGGVVNAFSSADLTVMDAIGWDFVPAAPPPPPPPPPPVAPPPTGVSLTGSPLLTAAQGANGLTGNNPLANVSQVGGQAGDTFTYTLGGTGSASFSMTSAGNAGTLSTGASGVAGAANGKLYALTVTANDTTAGNASPASAVDVVVGSSGADMVSVAAVVGASATATPSFIYGLTGNDTLNATGMTGKLWFVGGAGGDTMTGGSGVNDYVYGAVSDSTPLGLDRITNFHAATDLIDLTGIGGGAITYVGKLAGFTIAAHSVGWRVADRTTMVLVNTSGVSESVGVTNMKIALLGPQTLTSSNILHA